MNSITFTLQENEANALLQLVDIAVKAQGLQVAEVGSFLATKIREQAQAQLPTPEAPEAKEEEVKED